MINVIGVEKNRYVYNGDMYEIKEDTELVNKIGRNIKIIILEEPLLIKTYKFEGENNILDEYVDEVISRDFSLDDDLLFHYEYSKTNKIVFVYSVKKLKIVELIIKRVRTLEIIPIQFFIKGEIYKRLRGCRNYVSLTKIKEMYYIINVVNGYILNTYVTKSKEEMNSYVNKHKTDLNDIILDYNLNKDEEIEDFKFKSIKYLKIGELVNERLFKKQRFYSRKLY